MGSTIMKGIAILAAIGGLGFVVWYGIQDPRKAGRSPAEVNENLTGAMGLIKEALTLSLKNGSVSGDRLKEGIFQFSKSVSEAKRLRPSAKEKAIELVRGEIGEIDDLLARVAWTPELGGGIRESMRQLVIVVGGIDMAPPPLSHLSSEMVGAIDSLTETLGEVKDAASAEAALKAIKEADEQLAGANESKVNLSAEQRTTLQTLAKPALEKLNALVAKTLAKPGVSDKFKKDVAAVQDKLTALAS